MRIAAIQCPAIADDVANAIEAIVQRLRWAMEEGVDLIVFPEAFLVGHSYNPETIRSRAHEASASALAELCRRVAAFPVTLVVGAFEVIPPHIFNSAFVVEEGRIAGRYAKAYPNEPGAMPGSDFPTFVRSAIRSGMNVCNDAIHADAAEQIARQDADLILYQLNNMLPPDTAERWREKSLANLVERARQTGCWIASSDVTGAAEGLLSYGCTAIVAPDGHVVARVPELSESAAVYDVPERQLLPVMHAI
jgi:predicted amidohydrolase